MNIRLLADCVEVIPELAAWFRAEWPREIGPDAEDNFRRCTNKDEIPIGFVAFDASEAIGTVSILNTSVHSHNHLRPWIGGVYVTPEWRHRGVASALIDAALEKARFLGFGQVYVGISAARDFYENRGWEYLEDGCAAGDTVMVLTKLLAIEPLDDIVR